MKILARASLLFGIVYCLLAYATWGLNIFDFPYKAFAAGGVVHLALGGWMLKR